MMRDGTLIKAGWSDVFGWNQTFDHGDGYTSRSSHLMKPSSIEIGEFKKQGKLVGYMRNTGSSTGLMLIYVLRKMDN